MTRRRNKPKSLPEYRSVAAFLLFCTDDERETFDCHDLTELNFATHKRRQDLKAELEAHGLRFVPREPERRVRGFNSSNHDRWASCPMHGGSGWEVISGFAGKPERWG